MEAREQKLQGRILQLQASRVASMAAAGDETAAVNETVSKCLLRSRLSRIRLFRSRLSSDR